MTYSVFSPQSALGLILLALWVLPWKGVALWKAAKRHEVWWFVAILVLNTLALLEIFYIFVWTQRPPKRRAAHKENKVAQDK